MIARLMGNSRSVPSWTTRSCSPSRATRCFLTQWAAVSTQPGCTSVPPQKASRYLFRRTTCNKEKIYETQRNIDCTCQGQRPGPASLPPMILRAQARLPGRGAGPAGARRPQLAWCCAREVGGGWAAAGRTAAVGGLVQCSGVR